MSYWKTLPGFRSVGVVPTQILWVLGVFNLIANASLTESRYVGR